MKTHLLPILLLTAGCCLANASGERYVTVTAKPVAPAETATNTISIAEFEAAEIISVQPSVSFLTIEKDGLSIPYFRSAENTSSSRGTVIQGPATFRLVVQSPPPGFLTLKIMPESFPPDKTLIVPPGTNQVFITLESSTNLVHWVSATNGVYGSPNEAEFFRLKMTKLQP